MKLLMRLASEWYSETRIRGVFEVHEFLDFVDQRMKSVVERPTNSASPRTPTRSKSTT